MISWSWVFPDGSDRVQCLWWCVYIKIRMMSVINNKINSTKNENWAVSKNEFVSQSSVAWFEEARMEPKPCNGADRVGKHTSVVICARSPFPEGAELHQVTPAIQHSSRFLSGAARTSSQSVLCCCFQQWSPTFLLSRGFLTSLRRRILCSLQMHLLGTEHHSHWQVQGVWEWTFLPSSLGGGREELL